MGSRYDCYEDTHTRLREQLREKIDGVWLNKDISANNLKCYARAFELGNPAATIFNTLMTKVVGTASAGDTGIVQADVLFGQGYSRVDMRIALVDENTVVAQTLSGYKEWVFSRWTETVGQSPQ